MFSNLLFLCDKCKNEISREIFVPATNMEDNEGTFSDGVIDCPVCGKTFDLSINNKGGLVLVTANGTPLENASVSAPYMVSDYYVPDDILKWEEEDYQAQEEFNWYLSLNHQTVYTYFTLSMGSIKSMLNINIDDRHQAEIFNRMLLVQSIASMEAYLSDTIISRVVTDPSTLSKLFKIERVLKQEKYTVAEYLSNEDLPKKRAKKYLSDLIYHNLNKIEILYKKILNIQFDYGGCDNKTELLRSIQDRHDCVHRNGKTRYGDILRLNNKEYILKIIGIIELLVSNIEKTIEEYDALPF